MQQRPSIIHLSPTSWSFTSPVKTPDQTNNQTTPQVSALYKMWLHYDQPVVIINRKRLLEFTTWFDCLFDLGLGFFGHLALESHAVIPQVSTLYNWNLQLGMQQWPSYIHPSPMSWSFTSLVQTPDQTNNQTTPQVSALYKRWLHYELKTNQPWS